MRAFLASVSATEKRVDSSSLCRVDSIRCSYSMANLSLVSASLPLGEFGALQKMRLAVAMPLILVGIVAAYSVLKFVSVHYSSTANHDVRARLSRFLVHKAVTVLSSLFTALSIFYMRAILRPFNCIRDGTDGIAYMASSPDIPCIAGDAEYAELVALSTNGLAVYAGCYAVISLGLVVELHVQRGAVGGTRAGADLMYGMARRAASLHATLRDDGEGTEGRGQRGIFRFRNAPSPRKKARVRSPREKKWAMTTTRRPRRVGGGDRASSR